MIHYTCDCCKRPLDSENDLRYVLKMEIYASLEPLDDGWDDDEDSLQEMQDVLERIDDAEDDNLGDDVYQQLRFDLCPSCRKRLMRNPLAAASAPQLDFSNN